MNDKVKRNVRMSVEVVTPDPYLKLALQVLADEGLSKVLRGADPATGVMRVVLADTACLGGTSAERGWLSDLIQEADAYAFMSYSEASFDGVPHLYLGGSLARVRCELVRLVTALAKGALPWAPGLFSRLNHTELLLIQFLMCGYEIKEIHEALSLNLCLKSLYRIRSEVMKKYRIANKKELYVMLRVYDFITFVRDSGKQSTYPGKVPNGVLLQAGQYYGHAPDKSLVSIGSFAENITY